MLKKKNFITIFLFISILIRVLSIHWFGDNQIDMEWGVLLHNLNFFGTFGFNVFDGTDVMNKYATAGEEVFPSIFMPPLYLLFIFLISLIIEATEIVVLVTLYIQLLISILSAYFFYRLLIKFFSKRLSLIGGFIFLFFPLNIYAVSQISSITLQVFLLILFLYFLFQFIEGKNYKDLIKFSIISSLLILLRGEFFLIYFLTLFFILIKKIKFRFVILSTLTTLLIVSPYLIRNYKIFNIITITKSVGYNLWKGNNIYSKVEGNKMIYDTSMKKKIKNIKPTVKYDLIIDKIFKEEAIKNIFSDPKMYLFLYFKKFLSFLFFNIKSTYPNYYNFFHIIPKICISITTLLGIFFLNFKKNNLNYFSVYYLFNLSFFSLFFILPRYQLSLLPVQIILSCYLVARLKPNI